MEGCCEDSGIITTVAGTGGESYRGDGVQATTAMLDETSAVALDTTGNIYIADTGDNRIRKLTVSTGLVCTFTYAASRQDTT